MKKTYSNPCIRCGTERIVTRTWEEKLESTTIINIEAVCPNSECQKQVEVDNKRQKDKNTAVRLKSEQRKKLRFAEKKAKKRSS